MRPPCCVGRMRAALRAAGGQRLSGLGCPMHPHPLALQSSLETNTNRHGRALRRRALRGRVSART
eukprot:463985-Prymnesium_polylepis.1